MFVPDDFSQFRLTHVADGHNIRHALHPGNSNSMLNSHVQRCHENQ